MRFFIHPGFIILCLHGKLSFQDEDGFAMDVKVIAPDTRIEVGTTVEFTCYTSIVARNLISQDESHKFKSVASVQEKDGYMKNSVNPFISVINGKETLNKHEKVVSLPKSLVDSLVAKELLELVKEGKPFAVTLMAPQRSVMDRSSSDFSVSIEKTEGGNLR